MFDYEDRTLYCIYTAKQNFKKYIDLLLLSHFRNFHYVLINYFDRFRMTHKILSCNSSQKISFTLKRCKINFQNLKRLTKALFIISRGFYSVYYSLLIISILFQTLKHTTIILVLGMVPNWYLLKNVIVNCKNLSSARKLLTNFLLFEKRKWKLF